ncbi:MAG: U32 family peptidase [Desulfobacca sp.]|nr:U32 family peptidase [Desulfobacca sp.]
MEILAPAGNLEAFFAALEQGADAFYVGLKAFSARAYAHNFTLKELSSLMTITREQGRRLYVALNSLIKEGEQAELLETLAALNDIRPDALIIQDLGVYYLVHQHFPGLRLHASTLMTIHNSLGVEQAAAMGFKRVVLARELNLQELASIRRQAQIELEVFVHGALCFSFSGLCLFSSYLGGRAATRGRCTQPCRRAYGYDGQSGYLLSISDLSALELVPQLTALGIQAIKIEGRMKSGDYVGRVVRAYRQVLDAAPADRPEVLEAARELLARTYTRRTTCGFLRGAAPQDLLAPQDTGNIGAALGAFEAVPEGRGTLKLKHDLAVGDRLRVQDAASGERQSFTLKALYHQDQPVTQAAAGLQVEIGLPFAGQPGDLVFKVGETTATGSRSNRKWREYLFNLAPPTFTGAVTVPAALRSGNGPGSKQGKPVSVPHPRLDLRVRSLKEAVELNRQVRGGLILDLDDASFNDYLTRYRRRKLPRRLIWRLPPIILEAAVPRYRQAVATLREAGCRQFMVSNLGHLPLLAGGPITIFSDYPLHCLNSWAFQALRALGVERVTLSVEADRQTLKQLLSRVPAARLSSYLFAYLPLMVSRVPVLAEIKSRRLQSLRQENFRLVSNRDLNLLYPTVPCFLGKAGAELQRLGLGHFIVDLTQSGYPTREVATVVRQLERGQLAGASTAMNYYRGLE